MDSFGFSQFCISQALKESVSDIRGTLEGSSLKVFPSIVKVSLSLKLTLKVFQDCVEVHMQHIQQGLRLEIMKAINGDVNFNIHSLFYVQHDGKPDQVHGAAQSFFAKLGKLEERNCEVLLKTERQRVKGT